MYKVLKIDLNNNSTEYNIPEGWEVKGVIHNAETFILLLCFKYDQPTLQPIHNRDYTTTEAVPNMIATTYQDAVPIAVPTITRTMLGF